MFFGIHKPDSTSLEDLVKLVQKGEVAAFGKIYDKLVEPIFRFILFKVSDYETAQDLTQSVFTAALEKINKYKDQGNFKAWLYTIAKNQVIDHYRTKKTKVSLEDIQIGSGFDHMENVEIKETLAEMLFALNSLTSEEQEVIQLHSVEEYSFEEIAKITAKSSGSLRILKYRALIKLKKSMNGHE